MFTAKFWHHRFFVLLALIISLQIVLPEQAAAKNFRNSYVSFELPSKWDCYLENTAWVCRYAISKSCIGPKASTKLCAAQRKKTKEAIIILTAKEVGPKDSYQVYYNHLKKPRPIVTKQGRRSKSKIIHVKPVNIDKHKWVDGMHLGSEIPHYYTRYLATIKGNIAVLVTFSAHKLFYTKYSSQFFRAIKSLRVVATKASMSSSKGIRPKNSGQLGQNIMPDGIIDDMSDNDFGDGEEEGGSGSNYLFLIAFLLAAVGIYIWFKRRNN